MAKKTNVIVHKGGASYHLLGDKILMVEHDASGILLKESVPNHNAKIKKELRKTNASGYLGVAFKTRQDVVDNGEEITDETIYRMVEGLIEKTDIRNKIYEKNDGEEKDKISAKTTKIDDEIKKELLNLLSDNVGRDEFCIKLNIPLRVADSVRRRHEPRHGYFYKSGHEANSIYSDLKGCWNYFREENFSDGSPAILQGAIDIRSVIYTSSGYEICAALSTPNVQSDVPYFYHGNIYLRSNVLYWHLDQEDFLKSDFMNMTTIPDRYNGGSYIGTMTTMNQASQMYPIGRNIIIRRSKEEIDSFSFLRKSPKLIKRDEFAQENIDSHILSAICEKNSPLLGNGVPLNGETISLPSAMEEIKKIIKKIEPS